MSNPCPPVLLVLLALLATPLSLGAQRLTELSNRRLRFDCPQAISTLDQGRASPSYEWALRTVPDCGDSAIPAIARVWRRPPADTTRLEQLVWASTSFSDRRLLDQVTAAAADETRPWLVRLSALRVLAFYANPALYISLGQLDPSWIAAAPGFVTRGDGYTGTEGQQPLDASARAQAEETIRVLAATSRDERVRQAAGYLASGIETLRARR